MIRCAAPLSVLVLVVCAFIARAETAPPPGLSDNVQGMVGGWEISNTDRDRRCPLTFGIEPAMGGFKLELDPVCPAAFPQLGAVVAWDFGPKDVLRLLDAKGGAVMAFTEVESGMFESERGPDGLLFLQTQASLKRDTRMAEQVFGDWSLLRDADKPLCSIELSNTPGGQDNYRLIVKSGCDGAIAAFGLSTWRLDGDHLLLTGRGGTWRFAESDATTWERVPLSVEPLLLVRQ